MKKYDCIVIGCGGIGSAALYWASLRGGKKVLGLEQFRLGHERGSSQDHSRIIRLAYHEPEYAALAPHAYSCWHEIEAESGIQILHKTGSLIIEQFGARDVDAGGVRDLRGYVEATRQSNIELEELSGPDVNRRWPQFRLTDQEKAVFQKDGGLVDARKANAVHAALARARGALILEEMPVQGIRPLSAGVEVVTSGEIYHADSVIVASGAWTKPVLGFAGVNVPLTVTQEQVTYYATSHLREFAMDRFPVWIWHGEHSFYGCPVHGEVATKMGQHNGGPQVTADTRGFDPDQVRIQRYRDFLNRYIPDFLGPELYTKTCLYTLPPDQNFLLSTLPGHPQISVAVGAGHGFKFASLMGRILSQLAFDGQTDYPIEAFSLSRTAITDPDFQTAVHC
jgi:sarcosine oxidase